MSVTSESSRAQADRAGPARDATDLNTLVREVAGRFAEVEHGHLEAMRAMHGRLAGVTGTGGGLTPRAAGEPAGDLWDADSAEALTRAYETASGQDMTNYYFQDPPPRSAVAQPQSLSLVPPVRPALGAVAATAPAPRETLSVPPQPPTLVSAPPAASREDVLSALADDREWLDERLADIAHRVQESLAALAPRDGVDRLSGRFDTLERRFDEAFRDIPTRADIEGVGRIETDIKALTEQIERTRLELERMDRIESQLHDLNTLAQAAAQSAAEPEQMSLASQSLELPDFEALIDTAAERVASRLSAETPPRAPEPDFQALIEQAVERTASRIIEPARSPSTGLSGLEDMQQMLASFISERRREDSQTNSMLDAMQEALVRLIDRVDQLDTVRTDDTADPGYDAYDQTYASPAAPADLTSANHPDDVSEDARSRYAPQPRHMDPEPAPYHAEPEAPAASPRTASSRPPRTRNPVPPPVEEQYDPEPDLAAAGARPPRGPRTVAAADITIADDTDQPAARGQNRRRIGLGVLGLGLLALGIGGLWHMLIADRGAHPAAKLEQRVPVTSAPARGEGSGSQPQFLDTEPRAAAPVAPSPVLAVPTPAAAPRPEPRAETTAPAPAAPNTSTPNPALQAPPAPRRRGTENVTDDLSVNTQPGDTPGTPTAGLATPPPTGRQAAALATGSVARAPGTDGLDARTASTLVEMPPAQSGPLSLRLAAQKGDPAAQFEIAARFAEGKGIKQDFKEAMAWYQRAAQQGFTPAQYRLATLYERGVDGGPDLQRARLWYQRAADQGNVKAMHNIAVLSAGSDGAAAPDYTTAAQWFGEAAKRGLADSQFNLAVLAESGLGVAKDQVEAYKWFALAARSGDKEATRRRDAVLARLQPHEVRLAESRVASFRPLNADPRANDARAAADHMRAQAEQAAEAHMARALAQATPQRPEATAEPAPQPVVRSAPSRNTAAPIR